MIIYVFLIPWTYACQSHVFYHGYDSMIVENSIQLLGCGQLPVPITSGLPWWISVLQGSDWIPPRKFVLDEYSVLFYLFVIILDGILQIFRPLTGPPGQLKIPALRLAIDLSFLLGSFKLNWSDELSLNKKLTSIKIKTPTIMRRIYMVNTRLWSFKV